MKPVRVGHCQPVPAAADAHYSVRRALARVADETVRYALGLGHVKPATSMQRDELETAGEVDVEWAEAPER